jgi:hypothetical protein
MGKNFLETVAPIALGVGAMALTGGAAAPALAGYGGTAAAGAGAAGAAGATGAGMGAASAGTALGAGEAAASTGGLLSGGAFGSADMLAQAVPGAGLLGQSAGAATGAGNMAQMADGSFGATLESTGMTPNSYTGGYDSLNAFQRGGQRLTGMLDQMQGNPSNMLRMFNQPQQQQQMGRSPSIQRPQSQPQTEAQNPYGQTISGGLEPDNMTDEQRMRMALQMKMYGIGG